MQQPLASGTVSGQRGLRLLHRELTFPRCCFCGKATPRPVYDSTAGEEHPICSQRCIKLSMSYSQFRESARRSMEERRNTSASPACSR
jgi:hypothetical protein